MKKIKGPAIFLAQFIGDKEPFNSLPSICKWVSDLGYKGIQLPAENLAVFDLKSTWPSPSDLNLPALFIHD